MKYTIDAGYAGSRTGLPNLKAAKAALEQMIGVRLFAGARYTNEDGETVREYWRRASASRDQTSAISDACIVAERAA